MALYSRRAFLKLFGIAVAGASLPISFTLPHVEAGALSQGRAFNVQPVFKTRRLDAPIVNTLWPDAVTPILSSDNDWHRVPGGFVPRSGLQPMLPYPVDDYHLITGQSFWAEVAGAVASVRTFCAADAPLITRIGHGGISKVVDALPGEPDGWYGIEDDKGIFLGWTQANRWRPLRDTPAASTSKSNTSDFRLQIDLRSCQITALEQDKIVLQSACSIGQAMQAGDYPVQERQAGGTVWRLADRSYHGIPWSMHFGDNFTLAGIYWHNLFGNYVPGPSAQISPLVARWLYDRLSEQSVIQVL